MVVIGMKIKTELSPKNIHLYIYSESPFYMYCVTTNINGGSCTVLLNECNTYQVCTFANE